LVGIFIPRQKGDQFLVLGCDGLFDIFKDEEIIQLIWNYIKEGFVPKETEAPNLAMSLASHLTNLAFKKGSPDNISVVIII